SVTVDEAVGEMIGDLYDMLEENDDVRDVYMNI
ncbi:MAG: YebC/PmpR family DNA-binding transcriptional regulator, partial [Candidatus Magasanikbacteria bacterium CG10_big_fil_rev_8_21_14_0_10_43_6]